MFRKVMHMCIHIFPLQEVVENVETLSPETSGEGEGISCSDDIYSSFVYSQSCKSLYIPTLQEKLCEHRVKWWSSHTR